MAIIHPDSTCPICGDKLDRPYTATSGCAFAPKHRLWKYCDAPLHFDCLETWKDREEFSEGYFRSALWTYVTGYGSLLYQTDKWFLACGPKPPKGLPYFAEVRLKDWPFRLYSKFEQWTDFVAGDFRDKLYGEALQVAELVMVQVRQIAPDTTALTHLLDHPSGAMSWEDKYALFLRQYSDNSGEKPYYEAVFELLEALSPPVTEVAGLGCMIMLVNTDIQFRDGRHIPDHNITNMGTISDVAEAIAIYFADVEPQAAVWRSRYPSDMGRADAREVARKLLKQLNDLDIVEKYDTILS